MFEKEGINYLFGSKGCDYSFVAKIPMRVHLAANVQGWLSRPEGEVLYMLAKETDGSIIEIGSWKGRSTIYLASGLRDGKGCGYVYAIDHFHGSSEHQVPGKVIDTYPDFEKNILRARLEEWIQVCKGDSSEFAHGYFDDEKITMVFIDGAHEYEYVAEDFENYYPILESGGVMALHDYQWDGPNKVVRQNMNKCKNWRIGGSVAFGTKI